jgi:hypothetical protein
MADYLLYDPKTEECRGIITISPEQLAYNVEGGQLIALEIDGSFRNIKFDGGVAVETFDMEAIRRPLLAKIDADALAQVADPFAAIHAAQEAEARNLTGPTPYLDALVSATGQARADLAASIIAQADAATALKLKVNASRQAAKQAVRGASTLKDFAALAAPGA